MVESVFDRSERSGHQKKASHFQQLKKRHVQYFVHRCTEIAGFIKTGPKGPGEAQSWVRREADRVAEGSFWSPGNRFVIVLISWRPLGIHCNTKNQIVQLFGTTLCGPGTPKRAPETQTTPKVWPKECQGHETATKK